MGFYIGKEEAPRPREGFIPNPKLKLLEQVKPEIGTGAVRVVGSSLLATKKVEWLTAFQVARRRGVLYLVAAPRLVPLNLPENEVLRCLSFC
jgi:hypothetical protein